jgi:hypothetical protein
MTDATTLEALACCGSLALAEYLGLIRVHVASACSTIVSDIRKASIVRIGSII